MMLGDSVPLAHACSLDPHPRGCGTPFLTLVYGCCSRVWMMGDGSGHRKEGGCTGPS